MSNYEVVARSKTKVRSLSEHRLAYTKIIEYSNNLTGINHSFFGGGEVTPIITGKELEEWYSTIISFKWESCFNDILEKYRNVFEEQNIKSSSYTRDPSLIELFIETLYAVTLELANKIRNLKKIVHSSALVKSVLLNFDKRKMIQSLKHNFRHFDDEENNELKVARKQFYNSNFIKTSWKNLEINLMKYFPIQILTMS